MCTQLTTNMIKIRSCFTFYLSEFFYNVLSCAMVIKTKAKIHENGILVKESKRRDDTEAKRKKISNYYITMITTRV